MTNSIQSTSSIVPITASAGANRPDPTPQAPSQASAFTVEISRAATAPVYVYRLTDTATGRILVEIPNDPTAQKADVPGGKVDAKV